MDNHLFIPLRAALKSRVRACRSFLLTPGSRPELFPSARTGDAIIVDLESTVAPGDKGRAREAALQFLREAPAPGFVRILRINSPRSVLGLRDLLALHEADALPDAVIMRQLRGGHANLDLRRRRSVVGRARPRSGARGVWRCRWLGCGRRTHLWLRGRDA